MADSKKICSEVCFSRQEIDDSGSENSFPESRPKLVTSLGGLPSFTVFLTCLSGCTGVLRAWAKNILELEWEHNRNKKHKHTHTHTQLKQKEKC